jgi:hypothetical protein
MSDDLKNRSGEVTSDDPLVAFLYVLMRDHIPVGIAERLVEMHSYEDTTSFTNGWLANYAKDLAARLKK